MARTWVTTSTLCVSIIFGATLIRYGLGAVRSKGLPDCNVRAKVHTDESDVLESVLSTSSDAPKRSTLARELILVSTLDGYVSALDPNNDGILLWSHSTGDEALLSSSISQLEMNSNGNAVRLIPSLDGNLYKFDGESVEPIPVSADTLLKNSFKLGDDTIITGGKESSSYGISLHSGELRYSCEMEGCHTFGNSVRDDEDILVVRRLSQTVRAITPRSGGERWNFSVGEHHMTFLEKLEADCSGGHSYNKDQRSVYGSPLTGASEAPSTSANHQVQVIVPEGMIGVFSKESKGKNLIWSHKFESPIVHTWHLKDGQLEAIDLFDQKQILSIPNGDSALKPLLYVGRHQNQLYIQNSLAMKKKLHNALSPFQPQVAGEFNMPQIEWKPYVISSPSRTPYINHGKEQPAMITNVNNKIEPSTALVLKNADFLEYPYDSGYYLFGSTDLGNTDNSSCRKIKEKSEVVDETEEEEEAVLQNVIVVSFWHWWKEILGIAVCLAIMMNIFFTRHIVQRFKRRLMVENSGSDIQIVPATPTTSVCEELKADIYEVKDFEAHGDSPCEFNSRYLTDFEPIQRLGKGGFGVVFEARNKIDDCCYAVKRILLPSRVEAQEKVMREVRALAKLDHTGIVRYFNAWQESPPPGWQQLHDQLWEDGQLQSGLSSLNGISLSRPTADPVSPSKLFNPFKIQEGFSFSKDEESDESGSFSFENGGQGDQESFNRKNEDSFEIVFQSNSEQLRKKNTRKSKKTLSHEMESSDDTESETNETHKPSSWSHLSRIKEKSDSFVKFEDSGCADRSQSTDEEEVLIAVEDVKAKRPEELKLVERVKDSDLEEPKRLYLYIQMQLCRKETLKDWLTVHVERDHEEVLDIFDQIVSAVQYVHECNLMHRDLKPSNIFFSVDGTIKVGDFGLVTALTESEAHTPSGQNEVQRKMSQVSRGHTDQVGTQLYMSPEQIASGSYSHKVDIFSLGLIFFELLVAFPTQMQRVKALLNVKQHIFCSEFMSNHHKECALVKKLLSHDPLERPPASEIKQNELFRVYQPQPEMLLRYRRRRTLSQRISSSGSECDSQHIEDHKRRL